MLLFFFSSRRRHTRCALVTGVQTCALPIFPPPAEGSAEVAARVADARARQTMRYNGNGVRTNAEVDGDLLEKVAGPDGPGRQLLAQAAEAMRLSARGYTRVVRVARTGGRSEEPTSELQSLMPNSYAVFCLKK